MLIIRKDSKMKHKILKNKLTTTILATNIKTKTISINI